MKKILLLMSIVVGILAAKDYKVTTDAVVVKIHGKYEVMSGKCYEGYADHMSKKDIDILFGGDTMCVTYKKGETYRPEVLSLADVKAINSGILIKE